MDLTHLVHTVAGRLLRSPAIHYAVLGGVLFATLSPRGPAPPAARLVVPAFRIEAALQEFEALNERPLTLEEKQAVIGAVVDQEVLYAYALRLGLDKEPVVEQRLAQIATFVTENPHEAKSMKERASEALLLGLNEGDLVVRRILIDGARRLIRAAVLVREPPDSLLEEYLRKHPDQFRLPARVRISHVVVDDRLHRERTNHDAREILARLRADSVPPAKAAEYGDQGIVASNLPALPAVDIQRRFGHTFTEHLAKLPVGSWEGPILSRYGLHLVFVQERIPERTASLDEARKDVRARVRNKLADEWLATRMEQLRAEFEVEIGDTGRRATAYETDSPRSGAGSARGAPRRVLGSPRVGAGKRARLRAPSLLEVRETESGHAVVRWKQPAVRVSGSSLLPVLPESCRMRGERETSTEGTGVVASWEVECSGGLVGQVIRVEGIGASQANVLLRLVLADSRSVRHILTADQPSFVVPEREGVLDVMASYGRLGVEHILTGFDHLLFVLGLVLLVRGGRRLVWTVTAFTVGHSVTLALAILGVVHVPQQPLEAGIAFSIYVLAVALVPRQPPKPTLMDRAPWLMAGLFGLLHGLGFAGALAQVGLPQGEIPLALFAFNVGIEAGQLVFVGVVLVVWAALRALPLRWPPVAAYVPAYAMGTLAAFWFFERLAASLPGFS